MMRIHLHRTLRQAAVIGLVLGMGLAASAGALARTSTAAEIAASDLPKEGRAVLARIHAGGPFRYSRDGVVFNNRERMLPSEPRGYYHEYTVSTPGSHNRGARRIICGGEKTAPVACWYTDDHYESFRRIRE
jgi:ribonuclease T1